MRQVDPALDPAGSLHEVGSSNILISTANRAASAASRAPAQGPLAGWALVVKDLIDVAGFPTTNGSAHFDPRPVLHSAPVVAALVSAGAHVIGKANLDEYAWGVTGENLTWGRIPNPQFAGFVAGGSSGGTAAALAAGIARIGLGTDTAGSVRIPAAACGVVGLRPRNRVLDSRGAHPLAPSFDVVGPMARTVADVAAVWQVLQPTATVLVAAEPGALRLCVMEGTLAGESFTSLGAATFDVATPREILSPFWSVMRSEAYETHRERYAHNPELFGRGIRGKLAAASAVTVQESTDARAELAELRAKIRAQLDEFDAIVLPSVGCPTPPAGVDEESIRDDFGWPSAMITALDLAAVSIGNLQIAARTEADALRAALLWEERQGGFPRS